MSNPAFISFIKLKKNVIDSYSKTKKGWKSKLVAWEDMRKVMSNSKVQYSNFEWVNGCKTSRNFSHSQLTHLIWDIDDEFSIPEFQKLYKKYRWILGTTKSHQTEKQGVVCDRYRVCIEVINSPKDIDVLFKATELIAPFVDKQTLTKTAAFLGNDNAIIIYNEGKVLDMFQVNIMAEQQIKEEAKSVSFREAFDPDLLSNKGNSLQEIKSKLNKEIVMDILNSLGYEIEGNKLSLREERTKSVKLYQDGYMYDYGTGKRYDIFQVLVDFHEYSFSDSMKYVRQFI